MTQAVVVKAALFVKQRNFILTLNVVLFIFALNKMFFSVTLLRKKERKKERRKRYVSTTPLFL